MSMFPSAKPLCVVVLCDSSARSPPTQVSSPIPTPPLLIFARNAATRLIRRWPATEVFDEFIRRLRMEHHNVSTLLLLNNDLESRYDRLGVSRFPLRPSATQSTAPPALA
ncbi:hypothetical protein VPH35_045060 [Triticum aestivum]